MVALHHIGLPSHTGDYHKVAHGGTVMIRRQVRRSSHEDQCQWFRDNKGGTGNEQYMRRTKCRSLVSMETWPSSGWHNQTWVQVCKQPLECCKDATACQQRGLYHYDEFRFWSHEWSYWPFPRSIITACRDASWRVGSVWVMYSEIQIGGTK